MSAGWIMMFIAAFFEVFWVIGLKHADSFWTWTGTVISIVVSFYLLITAGRKLPSEEKGLQWSINFLYDQEI